MMLCSNDSQILKPNRHVLGLDHADREVMVREIATGRSEARWFEAWQMMRAISADLLDGPSVLSIKLEDQFDLINGEAIVAMWRSAGPSATDYTKGSELVTVREGDTIILEIPEIKGEVLELWCTDDLTLNVQIHPLDHIERVREEARTANVKVKSERTSKTVFAVAAVVVAAFVAISLVRS